MADWWSAGIDRGDSTSEENNENFKHKLKFNSFKDIPIFSIFNFLEIGQETNEDFGNNCFSLNPLNLDKESIFPYKINQEAVCSLQKEYKKLWDKFMEEFDSLPTDSFAGFEESLLYLLKKFTWAIPSNTTDMANVSLFDHLKTTAAIADCLIISKNSEEYKDAFVYSTTDKRLTIKEDYYPVLLAGFDISGIQSFIYDIASNKAAKSLKGRSFYIQLLAEAVIEKLKKHPEIHLKSAQILFASGGKFFVLLPNTNIVINALKSIEKEIEKDLWDKHKGYLAINIAWESFAYRNQKIDNNKYKTWLELQSMRKEKKNIADLWKSISDKINIKKETKFSTLFKDNFNEVFNEENKNLKVGGNAIICSVTGEEIENPCYIDNEKNIPVDRYVKQQVDLGSALKDADYAIVFKGNTVDDKYLNSRSKAKINVLNNNFYLFDSLELIDNEAEFRRITSADVTTVKKINDLAFLNSKIKGNKVTYGFQFYGGNKQAMKDKNNEKTFEELSNNTLLGVLRMDVDNLGNIFVKGFKNCNPSFSAYSTLSFMLDLFFSGYLNKLRDEEDFKEWVNILYSGGDDLFVIGRWDKIIDFAEQVKRKFEKFCGRKDIGLSAGIAIVHDKFPISKAAIIAGEAESQSKQYPQKAAFDKKEKNAITFFGQTLNWDKEFDLVKKQKENLIDIIVKHNASKALLHKIMLFKYRKDEKDISYLWNAAYYFKRYKDRYDKNHIIKNLIEEITKKLFEGEKNNNLSGEKYLDLLALAARWAEIDIKYTNK
jgi:CRISPR-associated protein Csm1